MCNETKSYCTSQPTFDVCVIHWFYINLDVNWEGVTIGKALGMKSRWYDVGFS